MPGKTGAFSARSTPASYERLRDQRDERAGSRWFDALKHVERFLLLDAYELVKHYLGLCKTFSDERPRMTLLYLFWEPSESEAGAGAELFKRHRSEVEAFAQLVGGDATCTFVASSYAECWQDLQRATDKPPWLDAHLDLLRKRYLVTL